MRFPDFCLNPKELILLIKLLEKFRKWAKDYVPDTIFVHRICICMQTVVVSAGSGAFPNKKALACCTYQITRQRVKEQAETF